MADLHGVYAWPRDTSYYYSLWSLASFVGFICLNHVLGELFFEWLSPTYRSLSRQKKIEWNCRVSSSLHASIVTVLSIISLVFDRTQWFEPIVTISRPGCIALAISIGYMLADIIAMIAFQKGLQLYLFTVHHIIVAVCFTFLLAYRISPIYAIIRLTCEISTPFLNQRWFYWTIGGEDADRKASVTTLIFTAFFILGRYILPIPYWYVFFTAFNSEMHLILKPNFPSFTNLFISCPVLLDVLNIVWGIPIYGIAKKALITLGYVKQSRIATANGSVQYQSNGSVESVSNGKLHDH